MGSCTVVTAASPLNDADGRKPMTVAIAMADLTYRYPGAPATVLNGISLEVSAGERVALLGPNGSGKTTLALHLNGLLAKQSGDITIDDLRLNSSTLAEIRRRVGVVFQDPDDQLFMPTVHADVEFGPANLGIKGDTRKAVVAEALAAVDATELAPRHPHHLSGGEKRRAAIATVLAMTPDIIVLDEPTSGLDPVGRRELAELLCGISSTQLVITHDLPFALATCPRSLIVDRGKIVADAPTFELFEDSDLWARHRLELPFGFALQPE